MRPYYKANIVGPLQARIVNSQEAAKILKRSKRALLFIGPRIRNEKFLEEEPEKVLIKLWGKATFVVNPSILKLFLKEGFEPKAFGILDIVNLLQDKEWKGFDGEGRYDLAMFLGSEYFLESYILSTLKNFTRIKTLSLWKYYQPNATYSFDNNKNWEIEFLNFVKEVV